MMTIKKHIKQFLDPKFQKDMLTDMIRKKK